MAIGVVVDPLTYHDRLGPDNYEMITETLRWAGPMDMHDVLRRAHLRPDPVVADVAMGSGQLSHMFRRLGASRVIGIDGSREFLDMARLHRAADEYHHCDVTRSALPLEDASVDLCTCSGLFSYLANPEPLAMDMTRVTRPGGFIAVNFHPARHNHAEVENISADCVGEWPNTLKRTMVRIYNHDANRITDLFEDLGAKRVSARHNTEGVLRAATGQWTPLATILFQKTPG